MKYVCAPVAVALALAAPTAAESVHPEPEALVVDSGRAPDGSRYAHVQFGQIFAGPGFRVNAVCAALRWPGNPRRNGGAICEGPGARMPRPPFSGVTVRYVQPGRDGRLLATPDVVIAGRTGARVRRVRVTYLDARGARRELPVDFAEPRGRLHGVFTAFLEGTQAARDGLAGRAARGDRQPGQPRLGDPLRTGDLGGLGLGSSWCSPAPGCQGPFRVRVYDRAGKLMG